MGPFLRAELALAPYTCLAPGLGTLNLIQCPWKSAKRFPQVSVAWGRDHPEAEEQLTQHGSSRLLLAACGVGWPYLALTAHTRAGRTLLRWGMGNRHHTARAWEQRGWK